MTPNVPSPDEHDDPSNFVHVNFLDTAVGPDDTFTVAELDALPEVALPLRTDEKFDSFLHRALVAHAAENDSDWFDREAEAIVWLVELGEAAEDTYPLTWHLYGVGSDGRLVFFEFFRDATVLDVLRAYQCGYFGPGPAEPRLLVATGAGWGGNGAAVLDLIQWLGDMAPEVLLGYLSAKGLDSIDFSKEPRLKELANDWATRNIDNPYLLRYWVESKRSWQVTEVAERLSLNEAAARELLLSLGFEDAGRGAMTLRSSANALARRDLWVQQEHARFDDAMESLAGPSRPTGLYGRIVDRLLRPREGL